MSPGPLPAPRHHKTMTPILLAEMGIFRNTSRQLCFMLLYYGSLDLQDLYLLQGTNQLEFIIHCKPVEAASRNVGLEIIKLLSILLPQGREKKCFGLHQIKEAKQWQ
jgi:hypothetical protein